MNKPEFMGGVIQNKSIRELEVVDRGTLSHLTGPVDRIWQYIQR